MPRRPTDMTTIEPQARDDRQRPKPGPTMEPDAMQPPASFAGWQPDAASAEALMSLLDQGGRLPVGPASAPPTQYIPQVQGGPQGGLMDWLATAVLGPVSAPQGPSTQEYINNFVAKNPGSPERPTENAFRAAKDARSQVDNGATGFQRDLNMRDAEHALFSQHLMEQLGPIIGRGAVAAMVPLYSGAKVAAQSGIPGAARTMEAITGMPLHKSSPPDFNELYWGLKPLFGRPY